jgi:hypothetical protein
VAQSAPATGWVDYDENQARIYAFADPAPFRQYRDAVAQIVQSALGIRQLDPESVEISEGSAWLVYRMPDELMTRADPVLPSRADAVRIAREALAMLERECSPRNERWRNTVGNASLFPPIRELSEAALAAIPRPDGSTYDHWLYRLSPTLTLDGAGRRRALVLGAQVEVRVGNRGQVIGVNSRWHPLSGAIKYVPITPFAAPPSESDDDDTASQEPLIQYVLDGEDAQQYYLSPYYARVEEHTLGLYSASSWSLTVDIGRVRQGTSTMTLVALAEGGSGDYAYHWGAFPDAGCGSFVDFDRGGTAQANRSASQIELPNGVYVVALNVLDRATGAFKHHRQIIASSPVESPDAEEGVA